MRTLPVVAAFLAASVAVHGAAKFATPPAIERDGAQVRISFALSERADVEVAVVDGAGRVVRHLAAGVLGADRPPPPPLAPGLAQQIVWDGCDDRGQKVDAAGLKVRVRAGMSVRFGRIIGASPRTGNVTDQPYRAPVNGLTAAPDGSLYVKLMSSVGSHGNSGLWPWQVRLFDSAGNYVRTILPYPPSTPREKASGFVLLDTPDGAFTPANQNSLYPVFYDFGDEVLPRLERGQIVFVNTRARTLSFFRVDGSNELRTVRVWPASAKANCPAWLNMQVAISPDGRYAYISNFAGTPYDGKKPQDIDPAWPQGRIYRLDLHNPDGGAVRWADLQLPDFSVRKYWMPSAWDKKTAAAGIDVDAAGNVLVGDLVNQQVAEFAPDGRLMSVTPVDWPDKVIVSRRTGALYVICRAVSRGALPPAKLVKIAGRGDGARVAAALNLPDRVGGAIALDESGNVPVLWLAGGGRLLRVEDRGDQLLGDGREYLNDDPDAIAFVGYMDVDREAELVYVTSSGTSVWRYEGASGRGGLLPIKTVDLAIGPGGIIHTWGDKGGYQGPVARYTRDLKPAPLGSGSHTYGDLYGRAGRGYSVCGMDVDSRGRVYAVWGTNACHLRVYDAEGNLVEFDRRIRLREGPGRDSLVPAAVDYVSGYGGSVRVDDGGNIYLLQRGLPRGTLPPPGYEKDEAWRSCMGTILKIGPEGASRAVPVDEGGGGGDPLAYSNVLCMYPGCAPISGWRCDGACACTKPRFDVDGFGRLYIPNAITFTVSVRDNAGNEIISFGHYGNFDCQGPDSRESRPEIPLGWPVTAGASDRFIYVGDCLNHRVVRVDKHFAAEHLAALP